MNTNNSKQESTEDNTIKSERVRFLFSKIIISAHPSHIPTISGILMIRLRDKSEYEQLIELIDFMRNSEAR